MKHSNLIGIFDSGIGGTSIWKEINKLLPQENTLYLADTLNAPYGEKPKDEILKLNIKNTEFLLKKDCKIIVVACNTATTNAINYLRNNYNVPFIGIEPAIKPAALKTKTNNIGVLATQGTLSSQLFSKTSNTISNNINIHEQNGDGLVQLIEKGATNSIETQELLTKYLKPMLSKNIDCLVLGCTHYPYLMPQIRKIVGPKVNIIDSGFAVAKQLKNILDNKHLLNTDSKPGCHQFYINSDKSVLKELLKLERNCTISELDF
ncbi:MAG: glutamate racemase [Flavobacteriaceae bacterium]